MTDPTCGAEHGVTPAVCDVDPDDHGPMHQGFSHFPGQLVVWPVDPDDPRGLEAKSRPAPGVVPDPPPWLDEDPGQLELPWAAADMRRCVSESTPHTSGT